MVIAVRYRAQSGTTEAKAQAKMAASTRPAAQGPPMWQRSTPFEDRQDQQFEAQFKLVRATINGEMGAMTQSQAHMLEEIGKIAAKVSSLSSSSSTVCT